MFDHLKRTWKAYGGAIASGALSYLMAALGLIEVPDAALVEGMREGFAELGVAAVTALATWVGVWFSPKNERNP